MSKYEYYHPKSDEVLGCLANCEHIAHHWAEELLTIFYCEKDWTENQHLSVSGDFKGERIENRSLVISSSNAILDEDDDYKNFTPDTLIFISHAAANEATITKWCERKNSKLSVTLRKDESKKKKRKERKNTFSIIYDGNEDIKDYRNFHNSRGKTPILGKFFDSSLTKQAIRKTRSKGARNSNQNSETQRRRKEGKPVKGCKVSFHGRKVPTDYKTMQDAHQYILDNWNYKKSYSTFWRELKTRRILELKSGDKSLVISLIDDLTQEEILSLNWRRTCKYKKDCQDQEFCGEREFCELSETINGEIYTRLLIKKIVKQ